MARLICSLPLAFILATSLTACMTMPSTYLMTSSEATGFRDQLGTLGVVLSEYEAEAEFAMPAKGRLEGMKRGFLHGAGLPILIGFVSPIPGGTFVGIVVSPFTGLYGAITGASKTIPVEEIDQARSGIRTALDRLVSQDVRLYGLQEFERYAEARTGLEFELFPDRGPKARDEEMRYSRAGFEGIDTMLEIRIESGGLWGFYDIDPPSVAFLEARVRLLRVADDHLILEDRIVCVGEQHKYVEWGRDGGQRFYDEILDCIPRLKEKIVDDLFLVYPVKTP